MVNSRTGLAGAAFGAIRKLKSMPRGQVLIALAIAGWVILIGLVVFGIFILHIFGIGVPSTR